MVIVAAICGVLESQLGNSHPLDEQVEKTADGHAQSAHCVHAYLRAEDLD